MQDMPQKCFFRAAQVRELDRRTIAAGTPAIQLMQRAGHSAYLALRVHFPRARKLVVLCGPGNNGGDGYVLATAALKNGLEVMLFSIADATSETARLAHKNFIAAGGMAESFAEQKLTDADVIVDALLGTGTSRPVEGDYAAAINAVNASSCPVIALDVPSGLNADTGRIMGAAVTADMTMTFITRKTGLYTGQGRRVSGHILLDKLEVDPGMHADLQPDAREASLRQCLSWLPVRQETAHKGDSGRLLIAGGDMSMSGAVGLAGRAACAAGAGLVYVATRPDNAAVVTALMPELLVSGIETANDLEILINKVNCILVGPGLGQSDWSRSVFEYCLEHGAVSVVDADGLNLLASEQHRRRDWVLTPHPAEAARLLGCTTDDIMMDRIAAARAIAAQYGGICVMKGSGTVIATDDGIPYLCTRGGPALATAGTGDVLAGLITGLIAQGLGLLQAAVAGVTLHASAGEQFSRHRRAGMLASDLVAPLQSLRNSCNE
jgi:NAD(P)H-hydrate epimerase